MDLEQAQDIKEAQEFAVVLIEINGFFSKWLVVPTL